MMFRLHAALLILALCLCAASAQAQMQLRHETTEPGRVLMIGNTLGLAANSAHEGPGTVGSIGVFTTVDDTRQVAGWPAGTTTAWRENSSSAQLDFDEYATVRYAELVWSGSWDYPEGVLAPDELDSPVSFQTPSGVFSVPPSAATTRTISQQAQPPATFRVRYYVRSADVTSLVRAAGPGEYIVSGVAGTIGAAGNELNAAGWTLVVIVEDPSAPTRNMTVFVGGEWVDEASALDTPIDGFCTPPSGPVQARLALSAVEGDAHFTGDQFLIRAPGNGAFLPLAGPNNPIDNFFGSQINRRDGTVDTAGTFGNANHNALAGTNVPGARQGWDITTVALSSALGHLGNAQTSTTVRGTSSSDGNNDSYVLNALAMEIDVNAPAFGFADNTLVDIVPGNTSTPPRSDTQVSVGDTLQFLYEIRNDGSADADSVTFHVTLPGSLGLVPGSFEAGGTPFPAITAADLADGVPLGPVLRVEDDEAMLVFFEATVLSIPSPPDAPDIVVQPFWDYTWRSCPSSPEIQARTVASPTRFGAAQLVLEKSAEPTGTLAPGDTITWTLVVRNVGNRTSRFAALRDDAPEGTSYVPGSTTLNGQPLADIGGNMPFAGWGSLHSDGQPEGAIEPGESAVVTFQSTIREDFAGTIRNSASAREADATGNVGVDDEIEIEVVTPDPDPDDSDAGDDADADADADAGDSDSDSGDSDADTGDSDADAGADSDDDADTADSADGDTDADADAGTTDSDSAADDGDADAGDSSADAGTPGSTDRGDRDLPSRPPAPPPAEPSGEVGTASGCCSVASGSQQRSATFGAVLVLLGLLRLRERSFGPV